MFITTELDNNLSLLTNLLLAYSLRAFSPYVTSVYMQFFFQEETYLVLTLFPGFVFPSFIPLIFELFLLKRSSRSTSLLSISIAQLGLVVWMTLMSFLRLNRFLSIVDIVSLILLKFSWVFSWVNSRLYFSRAISSLRLLSLWFISVVFLEIDWIMLFLWLLNITSCFFVIISWCCLNMYWKIFLIFSMVILVDPMITFPELMADY